MASSDRQASPKTGPETLRREQPSARLLLLLLLSLASAGLGAWELILTRLASVLFFHDLTYLCLAFALLALGLGGLWSQHISATPRRIWTLIGLQMGSLIPAWFALTSSDLAWAFGVFAVPFAIFGAASALAYRALETPRTQRHLYAAEALGALFGLVLLGPAVLPTLSAPVYDEVGVTTQLRKLVRAEGLRARQEVTTAYARTDLLWTQRRDVAYVFTDAMFVARAVAWDGHSPRFASSDIERLAALKRVPYRLAPQRDVLLLGAGAGFDVAVALQEGIRQITAVEINPQTIAFARELDPWAGKLLDRPNVEVHIAEARRFMQRDQRRWSQINITLVQSSPATGRGRSHVDARVLTVEALRNDLQHLQPLGVLSITQNTPELAQRTWAGLIEALGGDPEKATRHIIALRSRDHTHNPFSQLLLTRSTPWSTAERRRALQEVEAIGGALVELRLPLLRPATDDRPGLFEATGAWPVHVPFGGATALLVLLALLWRARQRGARVGHGGAVALAGAATMTLQAVAVYRLQSVVGNPALAVELALAAVLGGSALGALLLAQRDLKGPASREKRRAQRWQRAGLLAALATMLATLIAPHLAQASAAWSDLTALGTMTILIGLTSLPLGLPFLAALTSARDAPGESEGLIIGYDGIGGVLGAVGATAVTLTLGFAALGWLAAASFVVFALLGSEGKRRN